MENNSLQPIIEKVFIEEITFTDFISESRTGTMTFSRPNNDVIHCEFIDKERKIAKALMEMPTGRSFIMDMKYRFLSTDNPILIDVMDVIVNNDFRIHVYRGYLALASVETDEKRNFKLGRIHTTKDGSHGKYIDTDEVSEEGSDIFVVYNETVYEAMNFFLHMVRVTNRQSQVLILYHKDGMEKQILSFKFTDEDNTDDAKLFELIDSNDYRISNYLESDDLILPKFDTYFDAKIEAMNFYIGEKGPYVIIGFRDINGGFAKRVYLANVTAIDYFMSNALKVSQLNYRFYLGRESGITGYYCYAITNIPFEDEILSKIKRKYK